MVASFPLSPLSPLGLQQLQLPMSPHPFLTKVDSCVLGQPQEQTPVDGPCAEVGLKLQLGLRGCAAKEQKVKPLLPAGQPRTDITTIAFVH